MSTLANVGGELDFWLNFLVIAMSFITNLTATLFIGWTLWCAIYPSLEFPSVIEATATIRTHMIFTQRNANSKSQRLSHSGHILSLLLETGAAYAVLQLIILVLMPTLSTNTGSEVGSQVSGLIMAIYTSVSVSLIHQLNYPVITIFLIHGPFSMDNTISIIASPV
ncbi:hypothetical protein C0995_009439 [Termitomyces sp. Mi166|nr:hypothetical protein C0995_009439 [Termitomyces sp. Mi166\